MATVNLEAGTWSELETNIRNYIYSSDDVIIQLTADIDCNADIPEGLATTMGGNGMGSGSLTINGAYTENNVTKNRVIRNLRTHITSPVYIFKLGAYQYNSRKTLSFKNIDFLNLILDRPFLDFAWANANFKVYFDNCSIVGRRTQYFITCDSTDTTQMPLVYFTSCYINMDYKNTSNTYVPINAGTRTPDCYANYCRIKQNYTDWAIGTAADPYNAVQNITHNMYLNGCYLYGDFVGTGDSSSARINITSKYGYNAPVQSVVDANFLLGGTPTADMNCSVVAPKGIFVEQIHKLDEEPATTTYTVVNYNNTGNAAAIPIPPDKMTDAAYMASQGFDIVVPE